MVCRDVESSVDVEHLRMVLEGFESGADKALIAYFLNIDFHQYCSKTGMFDIPKPRPDRLRRPTWIAGFSITAIKDYIWDAIDKEEDAVDPAIIRGRMNFDFIDNFSHEKELIDELIYEAAYKWNKEVDKKAAGEEEKGSSHDGSGKIPEVPEREEEDDQERGQGDRAMAGQAVSMTSPLVPVIRLNPLPHTELKSYEFEIKIKKTINQLLDGNEDIKDEEITTKLMENDVIRKRIEELQSYSFSPLIQACRRQRVPHRIITKEKTALNQTAKKGCMSMSSLAASMGRAKPKTPTHGLTQPSHRMQPQLQLQPQPSQQTSTQVRPGTKLDSIPLARIVEIMTDVIYQNPRLTMSELRHYVIHALASTNLKCYKVIQLDYQAVYDEVTNICNKVIQQVKDYQVEVCLKSLQEYANNMKRPRKKRKDMGYKLPEIIDIRSPPARMRSDQSIQPTLDTDGLEIIKVQKDGDDIILVEGSLTRLNTVVIKQEPGDKPRISVKREPDDVSPIPAKQGEGEQQQATMTEERVIGSIEIIKKGELDVEEPISEEPPLEDPGHIETQAAADPDPIPEAIEKDSVDPLKGNGDMEQTGEPAPLPGVGETQIEPQIPTNENQAEPQISTGEAEIDDSDWPVSKDQIEGILIVAMAEPNYMDYTINDLLTKIRKSTGSSFHPFRSQIAVLAARAKDNRIEEDVRASARIQEEERKEMKARVEAEKAQTIELINIEEREYKEDRKKRHQLKKQQIVKGSHWEEVMARTKIVAFSGEAEDLEMMSQECWRKFTERREYLRISESERDGQQGTIRNKMKSFRKEKVKGLAKALPKSLDLQGLRDEVVKIMDAENFREITFPELVYSIQRSTNEDLGSGLSIVRALYDEVREQIEEQEQADIAEKEAQERTVRGGQN